MALAPGTRLGFCEIAAPIGAGGMGEVYRARDTRLDRDVAVKVLPEVFAAAPDRLARFEREAKLLASLNHPNIAQIHGLEESDSLRFLVLELVPGDTLQERLRRGPLSVDETLRLARQIAEALESAHGKGVIHRDLKPANVKVTPEGQVKVLDFGLAKALEDELASSDTSNSPTLSAMGTRAGMILGTAAYMSPEQARGLPVDKRSDIFSFGSLVFEMLTGRKAFDGELASDALASVIKSDPDWSGLSPNVPPRLRELLRRCLEKDPDKRRRDIGDIRVEIQEILTAPPPSSETRAPSEVARPLSRRAAPVLAALVTGILFGVAVTRRPEAPKPVTRFSIPLPEDVSFTNTGRRILAISPDGTRIVHTGNGQLYAREMSNMEATPVRGTRNDRRALFGNAVNPVFSPDGNWLAFWSENELKKVPALGGAPVTLCETPDVFGASWTEDDAILFGAGSEGIRRVSARGGVPEPLVGVQEGEGVAEGPQMLPDGDTVLFTLRRTTGLDDAEVVVQSLRSGERRVLVEGSDGRYLESGHLLFVLDTTLFAAPFDLESLTLSGGPVPVVEGVARSGNDVGIAQFSVSRSGTLAYVPGTVGYSDLLRVDRDGKETRLSAESRSFAFPRLSPDGRRLAVQINESEGPDIWIQDLARDTASRLTFGGTSSHPVWSPDGQWVAFIASREGTPGVYRRKSDFSAEEELVWRGEKDIQTLEDWTRDGRWLVYTGGEEVMRRDIWALSLEGDPEPRPVVATPFPEGTPVVSPDGRFIAYLSNESGRFEVYVTSFPDGGRRVQVSSEGGLDCAWLPHGDGIVYYYESSQTFVEVPIATEPELTAGTPRELFRTSYYDVIGRNFDVSPEGDIIMVSVQGGLDRAPIHVVLNWLSELEERVPTR